MKRTFSTAWKSSKRPAKQRKYRYKMPLHLRGKLLSTNLSKDLRKKYSMRNVPVKKGDIIKIMKGKFKGKSGKVNAVDLKKLKIEIEGVQITKQDSSKANVWINPAAVQITELNVEDKRRLKSEDKEKKNAP